LLPLQWLLIGGALLLSAAAFVRTRRIAKRLDRLTESYWELRYEHGQLQGRLKALEPQPPDADREQAEPRIGTTAFVPLSSLKR
jgi:hypothetical protein